MPTTITPTAVIAEFGSFYIDQKQNMDSLRMRPFEEFGTRAAFTNVPTNDTQLRYSDVQVGEVLQPYQDTFTAKGSVTFEPIKIDLQQVKVDQKFNPNNLVYSWLGFLTKNSTDRTTWPFTRWMIEVYILKQLFKDIETNVIYKGEKAAVVGGTAGAAKDIMNGIKKLINTYVAASKITPIAMGAVPADPADFCTYVEEMCEGIDELYWGMPITFNLSRKLELRYQKGRKKKYNLNYAQVTDLKQIENFDNFSVMGRASMNGSDKIWGTPAENAVFATKGFENASGFELEKVDREVKIWTDFHIGADFLLKDLVFTNDVELV